MITKAAVSSRKTLTSLANVITRSPQVILNMSATKEQKAALKTADSVKKILLDYNKKLESLSGRLLVRPSGTEPLIRITMWGNDEQKINDLANELKQELEETL